MTMVDARGYSCPTPVLMTKKAVQAGSPAQLEVAVDSKCAVENVTRYAQDEGYKVTVADFEGSYKLTLKK